MMNDEHVFTKEELYGYIYVEIKVLREFSKKPNDLRFLIETAVRSPWQEGRGKEGVHFKTPYWDKDQRSRRIKALRDKGYIGQAPCSGSGKGYRPGPNSPFHIWKKEPDPPWFMIDRTTALSMLQSQPDIYRAMLYIFSLQMMGNDDCRYVCFATSHVPECSRSNVRTAIIKLCSWGIAERVEWSEYARKTPRKNSSPQRRNCEPHHLVSNQNKKPLRLR
jgi:hypothetical protein